MEFIVAIFILVVLIWIIRRYNKTRNEDNERLRQLWEMAEREKRSRQKLEEDLHKSYTESLAEAERRAKEEKARKELSEKAAKNRQDALLNETVKVVTVNSDRWGLFSAVVKRSNQTYAFFERTHPKFSESEEIRLPKKTLDSLKWLTYSEYQHAIAVDTRKFTNTAPVDKELQGKIELLDQHGIQYLYHMTHINNLKNIIQNDLLSHTQARGSGLTRVDIADEQVNDRRSREDPIFRRRVHDYVPLYFNPKNPMLYRRGNIQNEIVILAVDRMLLLQLGTLFTNGNAASAATQFYSDISNLSHLDWKCINANYWNDFPDGKRIRCAEILVFPKVLTVSIQKVYCNNAQTQILASNILRNKSAASVELNTNLFFNRGLQQGPSNSASQSQNWQSLDDLLNS